MPWIEGIGDEVTITVGILLALCVLIVAWLSTGIRDIPFISVIIVQLTRRRAIPADARDANLTETDQSDHASNDQPEENGEQDTVSQVTRTDDSTAEASTSSEILDEPTIASITDRNVSVPGSLLDQIDTPVGTSVDMCSGGDEETEKCDDCTYVHKSDQLASEKEGSQPAPCPVSSSELRQRRLNFFSNNSVDKSSCDNVMNDKSTNLEPDRTCKKVSEKASASSSENVTIETASSQHTGPGRLTKLASNLLAENLQVSGDTLSADGSQQDANQTVESEQTGNEFGAGSISENQSEMESSTDSGEIRVRIKFLNDTQRLVTASATETIGNFRRRHFSTELSQSKLVRFIFNGQDLRNDASTLESYNIGDNSVLHCLVTQRPVEQQNRPHSEEDGFDIGLFMFPLFGLLLAIVWYMRFTYRQFFNVTSTLTLGGITFLYIAALMSSLRGHRPHEHID